MVDACFISSRLVCLVPHSESSVQLSAGRMWLACSVLLCSSGPKQCRHSNHSAPGRRTSATLAIALRQNRLPHGSVSRRNDAVGRGAGSGGLSSLARRLDSINPTSDCRWGFGRHKVSPVGQESLRNDTCVSRSKYPASQIHKSKSRVEGLQGSASPMWGPHNGSRSGAEILTACPRLVRQ